MPEIGTIDAVFILRRLQEEYHARGKKLYMCFMDIEKAFDRVPRKVLELVMRKNVIPGSVLSPFSFAVVVNVVTEFARESALGESLYADDLVLISETIEGLRDKFVG